jgi:hypothetical protein
MICNRKALAMFLASVLRRSRRRLKTLKMAGLALVFRGNMASALRLRIHGEAVVTCFWLSWTSVLCIFCGKTIDNKNTK